MWAGWLSIALRAQVWLLERRLSPCFDALLAAGIDSVSALCLKNGDEISALPGMEDPTLQAALIAAVRAMVKTCWRTAWSSFRKKAIAGKVRRRVGPYVGVLRVVFWRGACLPRLLRSWLLAAPPPHMLCPTAVGGSHN
jgi:hypothetical protein